MRVLVVEDEKKIASLVQNALHAEGFQVEVIHDGSTALSVIAETFFDVIVLDIMLPGRDGLHIVREMRAAGISTGVLAISARAEVAERVQGLESGADDYLPKPFVLAELVARVRALGRRQAKSNTEMLKIRDLVLDPLSRTAHRGGIQIELAAREFKLLEFLLRSKGRICGRKTILENVWEYNFDPGTNLVDVYVMRLREKIDADFNVKLLHTVRGIGYVIREEE
ncbi:MAG TPA: response regulator transcription factor [Verrucomicrobiae bacterium]|nr:response regulator transcription factor [Verrucomicrobiae bacterium]